MEGPAAGLHSPQAEKHNLRFFVLPVKAAESDRPHSLSILWYLSNPCWLKLGTVGSWLMAGIDRLLAGSCVFLVPLLNVVVALVVTV